jgi:CelD/BcsL family acetyltransferase involved in cellulose biosynthesis
MITVVSTTTLRPEASSEWDRLIRDRFRSAHRRAGWVSGQLLHPVDSPDLA